MGYKTMVYKFLEFTIYTDRFNYHKDKEEFINKKYETYIKSVLDSFDAPLGDILVDYLKLEHTEIQDKYREIRGNYFWYYHELCMKEARKENKNHYKFPYRANIKRVKGYQNGI